MRYAQQVQCERLDKMREALELARVRKGIRSKLEAYSQGFTDAHEAMRDTLEAMGFDIEPEHTAEIHLLDGGKIN